MPSNTHFASALQELLDKRPNRGLFARCFAEADGDEAKTKARYITLRAAELEEAEAAARKAHAQELNRREAAAREAHAQELSRREAEHAQELRRREAEHRKLLESFTFEMFKDEYRGEIALHYYGWREQQQMFKQWRKQKIESL